MGFQKAIKSKVPLWLILEGGTGSGKTMSALRLASGISDKIAVIDTERSSSSLYADRFNFDVQENHEWSLESYKKMAKEAADAGYEVLIIDSISHAWKKLTEEMDEIASAKYRGNTMMAWTKVGKPKWNKFIDDIFSLGIHVIVTSRVKMGYDTEKDENGKTKMVQTGLEAQVEKDFDYEFTLVMRMNQDHIGLVIKDRTGRYQDKSFRNPGEELGKELLDWLNSGEAVQKPIEQPKAITPTTPPIDQSERDAKMSQIIDLMGKLGWDGNKLKEECIKLVGKENSSEYTVDEFDEIIDYMKLSQG